MKTSLEKCVTLAEFYVNVFFTSFCGLFLGQALSGTQQRLMYAALHPAISLFSLHCLSASCTLWNTEISAFSLQALHHEEKEALVAIHSAICFFQRHLTNRKEGKVAPLEPRIFLSSQVKISDYPVNESLKEKQRQNNTIAQARPFCW